ncbi:MAG: UDP-galactopyranose mutase [Candidatus Spyradenecus sp.]
MTEEMTEFDALVVGAGLWGCVVARELAEAGNRVLVLEARSLPGGNARSQIDPKTGIECHCYGAHIFHTSDERVWDYANRFISFTDYHHRVLTEHDGKVYFMPLGLALINAFYGTNLKPADVPGFIAGEVAKAGLTGEPRNLEEQAISLIGRPLYEAFIKGYTQKQWNTDPKDLPSFIIRRLPVRANYDIGYFNDPHQGVPREGYFTLFSRLLDHPAITVRYNTDYLAQREAFPAELPVFYSGPLDAYFNYRYGALPWRGLRFEWETKPVRDWQGCTVMNYADASVPYTRIHEFKHFHPEREAVYQSEKTIICREFPADWKLGDIPYYPVNTAASAELLAKYQADAAACPNVIFGGRLGEYRYYDMDKVIARALDQVHAYLAQA